MSQWCVCVCAFCSYFANEGQFPLVSIFVLVFCFRIVSVHCFCVLPFSQYHERISTIFCYSNPFGILLPDRLSCIVQFETETLHFRIAFQFLFNSLPFSLSLSVKIFFFRWIFFFGYELWIQLIEKKNSISRLRNLDLRRRVLCPTFK